MNLASGVLYLGTVRASILGQSTQGLTSQTIVVPTIILNPHFSNLNTEKTLGKLVEIQIALGSEY